MNPTDDNKPADNNAGSPEPSTPGAPAAPSPTVFEPGADSSAPAAGTEAPAPVAPAVPSAPVTPTLEGMGASPAASSLVTPPRPSNKRRKLFLFIVIAVFVLAAGSAAAYKGYIVPNKPNNVVTKAFSNMLQKRDKVGFAMNLDMATEGQSTPSMSMTMTGSQDKDLNMRLDLGVSVSAFKLTGSTIVRTNDKTAYVKINELPSLLSLIGSDASELFKGITDKLDKNWVKIDVEGLKKAGLITDEQAANANSCIDSLKGYYNNNSQLTNAITDAYEKHMFLNATKVGKESVDNVFATKYKLDINQQEAKNFATAIEGSLKSSSDGLIKACGITDIPESSGVDEAVTETKIEDAFVWVTGDKQVAQIALKIKEDTSSGNVNIKFNDKMMDSAVPANIVTIDELVQDYQTLLGGSMLPATDLLEL